MSAPLPDDEKSKRNAYTNTERVGWSENIPGVQRIQLNSLPQHFNSNSSLQFLSSSYVWTAKENNQADEWKEAEEEYGTLRKYNSAGWE